MLKRVVGPLVFIMGAMPPAAWPQSGERYLSPWKTPWTYDGEKGSDHWAELDADYAACAGKAQSPIDIEGTQKSAMAALRFEYRSGPIDYVINDGHKIRVNYGASGSGDFLIVGEKRYQLTQFHFHHPSEETIHGKAYDMVVHLVHEADDGEIAAVAVLVKIGGSNATIHKLWQNMPKDEGQTEVEGLAINPADLLPGNTASYYAYTGSQTNPPCTEGVKWFILKTPIEVASKDAKAFAKLYPHDVRPLQPGNGRVVMESD